MKPLPVNDRGSEVLSHLNSRKLNDLDTKGKIQHMGLEPDEPEADNGSARHQFERGLLPQLWRDLADTAHLNLSAGEFGDYALYSWRNYGQTVEGQHYKNYVPVLMAQAPVVLDEGSCQTLLMAEPRRPGDLMAIGWRLADGEGPDRLMLIAQGDPDYIVLEELGPNGQRESSRRVPYAPDWLKWFSHWDHSANQS